MLQTLSTLTQKVFGNRNQRLLKQYGRIVERINALEPEMQSLSDEDLAARTPALRERAAAGETLDDLLPEAFAAVREAARRTLDMRHFDVQLVGGIVLHNGKIAEMRTGEGKTLVATLPAYLNTLGGKPVHIVTVNDYLARRDADWMGQIYRFLGLSVGVIVSGQANEEKRAAYAADITYGTNNEYGFDYLRDNMAFSAKDRVQRGLAFGIVDEVDSILIDEARTPLIISGPTEDSTEMYQAMDKIVPKLERQKEEEGPGDFSVDEKSRQVYLTDAGNETAERLLIEAGLLPEDTTLYDAVNIPVLHHLNAALRGHVLFKRDVDYIVRDNQIIIIDEFTGRMMPGRRWSEGLHQAIEAKEGVNVQQENQTLASITFQNYFRMYDKLSGMTGTADTEAPEFQQIYELEVVIIPTHMDMIRADMPDQVYRTRVEKFDAVLEAIRECNSRGQPVLVGTTSIETSEYLAGLLREAEVPHEVLNAKQHEREAQIIAQAGKPGAVTIATNMAGRGTDIVLGGNLELELAESGDDPEKHKAIRADWNERHRTVVAAGGLHVIGTERHESRRVDNQLRGRSGRQGDPGSSRFYLSLEDSLLRIFGSEKVAGLMERMGMEEGEAIEHKWVTRAIENAQRKVEGRNFDIRKQLLEYDDVANEQRKVIYQQRNWLMDSEDIADTIAAMRNDVIQQVINQKIAPGSLSEQWDVPGLIDDIEHEFGIRLPVNDWLESDDTMDEEAMRQRIAEEVEKSYQAKVDDVGEPLMRHLEKAVMLRVLDQQWKDHLASMDYLRHAIGLRGYAQRNPKQEYKREAFEMFEQLLHGMKHEVVAMLQRLRVQQQSEVEALEARSQAPVSRMQFVHPDAAAALAGDEEQEPGRMAAQGGGAVMRQPGGAPAPGRRPVPPPSQPGGDAEPQTFVRSQPKVGRNEPCPCGSGKKYKQCHGRLA